MNEYRKLSMQNYREKKNPGAFMDLVVSWNECFSDERYSIQIVSEASYIIKWMMLSQEKNSNVDMLILILIVKLTIFI